MLQFMTSHTPDGNGTDQIGQLLGTAVMLIVLFMVVAVIAEQILELFRGTLERRGITGLKSGISMDEAKKTIASISSGKGNLLTQEQKKKIDDAVKRAEETQALFLKKSEDIAKLKTDVSSVLGKEMDGEITKLLDDVAATVGRDLDQKESKRLYILRILTIAVCTVVCWSADINAFAVLGDTLPKQFDDGLLTGLLIPYINLGFGHIATGIAASAGSQYWHDILDRVRAAKSAVETARAVASN